MTPSRKRLLWRMAATLLIYVPSGAVWVNLIKIEGDWLFIAGVFTGVSLQILWDTIDKAIPG